MLRKYAPEFSHVLQDQLLEVQENLTCEEKHLRVLDKKKQVLRIKVIHMVKVRWNNHGIEEAT